MCIIICYNILIVIKMSELQGLKQSYVLICYLKRKGKSSKSWAFSFSPGVSYRKGQKTVTLNWWLNKPSQIPPICQSLRLGAIQSCQLPSLYQLRTSLWQQTQAALSQSLILSKMLLVAKGIKTELWWSL